MVSTNVALGAVAATLVLGVTAAWAGGALEVPSAGVVDEGEWGEVTEERTEIVTTVWVNNPNSVIDLAGGRTTVDYSLAMNGVRVADGTDGFPLERGNQTRELNMYVENDRLTEWWVEYVRANETVTARFEATAVGGVGPASDTVRFERDRTYLQGETPILDAVDQGASRLEGTYAATPGAGTTIVVESVETEWGEVDGDQTTLVLRATVRNPADSEQSLTAAGFERLETTVVANDVRLVDVDEDAAALSGVDPEDDIEPGETREVALRVPVETDRVDDWFRAHVENGERTDLEVSVRATVEDPDTGDTVVVPDESGVSYTCQLTTSILVDTDSSTTCAGA